MCTFSHLVSLMYSLTAETYQYAYRMQFDFSHPFNSSPSTCILTFGDQKCTCPCTYLAVSSICVAPDSCKILCRVCVRCKSPHDAEMTY